MFENVKFYFVLLFIIGFVCGWLGKDLTLPHSPDEDFLKEKPIAVIKSPKRHNTKGVEPKIMEYDWKAPVRK